MIRGAFLPVVIINNSKKNILNLCVSLKKIIFLSIYTTCSFYTNLLILGRQMLFIFFALIFTKYRIQHWEEKCLCVYWYWNSMNSNHVWRNISCICQKAHIFVFLLLIRFTEIFKFFLNFFFVGQCDPFACGKCTTISFLSFFSYFVDLC